MLNKSHKYLEIVNTRGKERKELKRVYRNIRNLDLFILAYGKLYANKGAMTPGSNPEDTIDGTSLQSMKNIIHNLGEGVFKWEPTRRVKIPKKSGGKRPLGMPNWTDKLVQEVIRMILEAYYEPKFSRHSHGFRPKRGCHTALSETREQWSGTKWFIEGDIRKCFDMLDHDILLGIMERDIKDERLIKLIREMLKAGYLDKWGYNDTMSGTPQGGVISPLLSNIYLNELDTFVEKVLMPKYSRGDRKKRKVNPVYNNLKYRMSKAKKAGNIEAYKHLRKEMQQQPCYIDDENYRRLKYVRYADDFLLGFAGPKSEANEIKKELGEFLKTIKLELSEEKTLITHATNESARFLSYCISVARDNSKRKDGNRSINGRPMLRIPREVRTEWSSRYKKNNNIVHRSTLLNLSDYEIALTYNLEFYGLVNYYCLAVDVTKLYQLKYVMTNSLVKTLAVKHKTKATSIYRKHSDTSEHGIKCLRIVVSRDNKKPLVIAFGGKPIRYQKDAVIKDEIVAFFPGRNELTDRLTRDVCEGCDETKPVQGHHVKNLKDLKRSMGKNPPKWIEIMVARNRKTFFVCHECHVKIHNGTYDGPRLK